MRGEKEVKSPYNLNSFRRRRVAALGRADEVFAQAKVIGETTKAMYSALAGLAELGGYEPVEPGANFVLLKFGDGSRAQSLHAELCSGG